MFLQLKRGGGETLASTAQIVRIIKVAKGIRVVFTDGQKIAYSNDFDAVIEALEDDDAIELIQSFDATA